MGSKPAEIYRACLESVVFGCRVILDAVRAAGVTFNEVVACGGLTENELLMQMYADVLGLPIRVSSEKETVACGAAMYGAMSAGFADVAPHRLPLCLTRRWVHVISRLTIHTFVFMIAMDEKTSY
jgi:ribulose kinase